MGFADQWNWVLLAYSFCYAVLVVYVVSIAARIAQRRRQLSGDS